MTHCRSASLLMPLLHLGWPHLMNATTELAEKWEKKTCQNVPVSLIVQLTHQTSLACHCPNLWCIFMANEGIILHEVLLFIHAYMHHTRFVQNLSGTCKTVNRNLTKQKQRTVYLRSQYVKNSFASLAAWLVASHFFTSTYNHIFKTSPLLFMFIHFFFPLDLDFQAKDVLKL